MSSELDDMLLNLLKEDNIDQTEEINAGEEPTLKYEK